MTLEAWICFLFSIVLMGAGIFFRNNNKLYIAQVLWLILLAGLNTEARDFENNESIYDSTRENTFADMTIFTWSYDIFAYFFRLYNMDFVAYNFFTSAISILLISYLIKKYGTNYNWVLFLVFLYPFPDFVIQKRFLPAMAIMLYFTFFLKNINKKNLFFYAVGIAISMGMHSSLAFFAVFFMCAFISNCMLKWEQRFIATVFFLELITVSYLPAIIGIFFPEAKTELYFVTFAADSNWVKFSFWCVLHLFVFAIIRYVHNQEEQNVFGNFVYRINLYSLLIIPLYYFDPVFIRYYRIAIILDYIYISNLIPDSKIIPVRRLFSILLMLIAVCLYSYVFYHSGSGNAEFDTMIQPIYTNNLLVE